MFSARHVPTCRAFFLQPNRRPDKKSPPEPKYASGNYRRCFSPAPSGARTGYDTKRPWHAPYTIDNTIGLRRGSSTSAAHIRAARRDAGRLSTHEAWPQPPIRTLSSRCDLPGPYFTGDASPGTIRRRGCQPG